MFWSSLDIIKTDSQREGVGRIIDTCLMNGIGSKYHASYILATAYHETGGRMQPVREGFATTNEGAIRAVTRLHEQGRIRTNYALPINGHSYYGRGLVQITWLENYKRVGKLLGVDLVNNPDLALDPQVSADILVKGMLGGWFTGRKLSDYDRADGYDYYNARRIVNGVDKAAHIAGLAIKFEKAITEWSETSTS